MGVDHTAVSGMGIQLTEDDIEMLVIQGHFTHEEYEDDIDGCFSSVGLCYSEAGQYCYTGDPEDRRIYVFVEGETLHELSVNQNIFIDTLNKLGLDYTHKDIKSISDVHVW